MCDPSNPVAPLESCFSPGPATPTDAAVDPATTLHAPPRSILSPPARPLSNLTESDEPGSSNVRDDVQDTSPLASASQRNSPAPCLHSGHSAFILQAASMIAPLSLAAVSSLTASVPLSSTSSSATHLPCNTTATAPSSSFGGTGLNKRRRAPAPGMIDLSFLSSDPQHIGAISSPATTYASAVVERERNTPPPRPPRDFPTPALSALTTPAQGWLANLGYFNYFDAYGPASSMGSGTTGLCEAGPVSGSLPSSAADAPCIASGLDNSSAAASPGDNVRPLPCTRGGLGSGHEGGGYFALRLARQGQKPDSLYAPRLGVGNRQKSFPPPALTDTPGSNSAYRITNSDVGAGFKGIQCQPARPILKSRFSSLEGVHACSTDVAAPSLDTPQRNMPSSLLSSPAHCTPPLNLQIPRNPATAARVGLAQDEHDAEQRAQEEQEADRTVGEGWAMADAVRKRVLLEWEDSRQNIGAHEKPSSPAAAGLEISGTMRTATSQSKPGKWGPDTWLPRPSLMRPVSYPNPRQPTPSSTNPSTVLSSSLATREPSSHDPRFQSANPEATAQRAKALVIARSSSHSLQGPVIPVLQSVNPNRKNAFTPSRAGSPLSSELEVTTTATCPCASSPPAAPFGGSLSTMRTAADTMCSNDLRYDLLAPTAVIAPPFSCYNRSSPSPVQGTLSLSKACPSSGEPSSSISPGQPGHPDGNEGGEAGLPGLPSSHRLWEPAASWASAPGGFSAID